MLSLVPCVHQEDGRGVYSAANGLQRRYRAYSYNEHVLQKRDNSWLQQYKVHKIYETSVFAADYRVLMNHRREYSIEHVNGRSDHYTCNELSIMNNLLTDKTCLMLAEGRGEGIALQNCADAVYVYYDDAIGYERR